MAIVLLCRAASLSAAGSYRHYLPCGSVMVETVNMNGRVYDPLTAQFFSPDPYVQAPGLWLNYNRF